MVAASDKGSSSTQSFIKAESCFISTEMIDKQPINLSYEPIPLEMTESKEQNIGSSSYYDLVPLIIDEGEITHEEEIGKPSPDVSFAIIFLYIWYWMTIRLLQVECVYTISNWKIGGMM